MEENQKGVYFAMGFLTIGFTLYVVADSGLFHNEFLNKLKVSEKSKVDEVTAATRDATSIQSSLDQARREMDDKKRNLVVIAEAMKSVDESIAKESREVEQLQKRLRELEANRGDVAKAIRSLRGERAPAKEARPPEVTVQNLTQLLERVRDFGVAVETIEAEGRALFRLSETSSLFSEENYLRPAGLRVARTLAAGFTSLSSFELNLNYLTGDDDARERALIVKRYVKEILGGRDPVKTQAVPAEELRGGEQVEILISEVGE